MCVGESTTLQSTMFRIDEGGTCTTEGSLSAKHWLSGEAIISGLGGLVGTGTATTGVAGLLETHSPGTFRAYPTTPLARKVIQAQAKCSIAT